MSKDVWRPTMSSDVVFELVDLLEATKRTTGLSLALQGFLKKLDSLAYDIGRGNRKPAYVATEVRKTNAISLESLGGLSSDIDSSNRTNPANFPTPIAKQPKLSADLDADMEAELERLNNEMLAGLEGNTNVILEERRKTPRIPTPTGDALFAALTDTVDTVDTGE